MGNRKPNLNWLKWKGRLFSRIKEGPGGEAPGLADSAATRCQGPWVFPPLCSAAHSIGFNLRRVTRLLQWQSGWYAFLFTYNRWERKKIFPHLSLTGPSWVTAHALTGLHLPWKRVWGAPWQKLKERASSIREEERKKWMLYRLQLPLQQAGNRELSLVGLLEPKPTWDPRRILVGNY